jgi:hypothetical protein
MNTLAAYVPTFNATPSQPPAGSGSAGAAPAPTPIVDLVDIRRQMDEVKARMGVNDKAMHRADTLRKVGFGTFLCGAGALLAGAATSFFAPSLSWGLIIGGVAGIGVGAPTALVQSRKAMDANFACLEDALELYKLSTIEQLSQQTLPQTQQP